MASSYRQDMRRAWSRIAAIPTRKLETRFGMVEYAEQGTGLPVLVCHGVLGGYADGVDGWWTRMLGEGLRVIAPSRFGYFGSTLPPQATPADQAEVYALLLDRLGVDRAAVLAYSAGSASALELGLRHPDLVADRFPFEDLTVPTLIVSAVDDHWARHEYAVSAAGRIPGARLVTIDRGGHLSSATTARCGPRSAASSSRWCNPKGGGCESSVRVPVLHEGRPRPCPGHRGQARGLLEGAGVVRLPGRPLQDRTGGLITFETQDGDQARRAVDADPFLQEGLLQVHWLKQWTPE